MPLLLSISFHYLTKRIRQTIIAIIGVTLGVMFFISIASMMQGMQLHFINQIVDVAPHIIISDEYRNPEAQAIETTYPSSITQLHNLKPKEHIRGIRNSERIIDYVKNEKHFLAEPVLTGQAFIRFGTRDYTTNIVGIKPELEKEVGNIEKNMVVGSFDDLVTNPNGIIMGEGLVNKIGLALGDKFSVTSPKGIILSVKLVGIFSTGITAIDFSESYMLLKKSQILQDRPNVINSIKIKLPDPNTADLEAKELESLFLYKAASWQENNQNIFSIFSIQNGVMISTVGAILVVASFGIFNIISTIVNEKTKDIAILKSIGFSENDIVYIFLFQGIITGIMGTLVGWLFGYLTLNGLELVRFRVEGEAFLRMEGFYLYRSYWLYFISGFVGLLSATIAAFLPARKAAKLDPVEIIRGAT